MKVEGHPQYSEMNVTCSCGATWKSGSTLGRDLHVEVCSSCHPFYTGKQKLVDTAGRVDRFRAKSEKAKALRDEKSKKGPKAPRLKKAEKAVSEDKSVNQ